MSELMKEFEDSVKALLVAMAFEGAKLVVKRLDEKREPVADAARTLYLDHGFTLNWLRARKAEEIIGACVSSNRHRDVYVGLIDKGMRCVMAGESFSVWGPAYPDREKTADAAQWLYQRQDLHAGECFLLHNAAGRIRGIAKNHQLAYCAEIADNAWIAFDEGGYRDVLRTLGAARIQDYAEQAKARRAHKETRQMLGVLNIEGYGEHGPRVKVEGVPVFEAFVLNLESELIKRSAKIYGITSLTGASFSSGPGIYQ